MKAKIIQDGKRVVITFTGIEEAETFLQKVVNIVSDCMGETVIPQQVCGLMPPVDEEINESYEEDDFKEPFAGKTPEEIISAPRFEGFFFLCRTEIPARYKEECDRLLVEFARKKDFFPPPYGEPERMKNYLAMAQKILGSESVPAANAANAEELDVMCEYIAEKIQAFFEAKQS